MMCKQKSRATKMITVFMVFSMILPSNFAFGQTDQKDYYYEGQAAAERDYNGDGALIGGIASGFLLGFIGWGIGYLIIANKDVEVPHHYTTNLDTPQRLQYEQGYKEYVKKTRKSKFNMGGGAGTLVAVVLVVSSSE